MPRVEKVFCDVCGKDITSSDREDWRLVLKNDSVPVHGPTCLSVYIRPLLTDKNGNPVDKYFCSLECLKRWARGDVKITKELVAAVVDGCSNRCDGVNFITSAIDPDWKKTSVVDEEDWRYYVPQAVRNVWSSLSADARLSLYLVASEGAEQMHGREGTGEDR